MKEIKVSESNKAYRSIDGVLYTKDLKTIICYPKGKEDEKFVIPSGVTCIGEFAFSYCENLKEINIPTSVTCIGEFAFSYCENLKEINIPTSVTCIGKEAFSYCENLKEIKVSESNKAYRSIDGVLYTKDLKTIICYPKGKEDEKFAIPSGVTCIEDIAFSGCSNLKEINIPSGVTCIGEFAFSYCENLKEINIPRGTLEKFKKLLPDEAHLLHEV